MGTTKKIRVWHIHELVMEKNWLTPQFVPMKGRTYFTSETAYAMKNEFQKALKGHSRQFTEWRISTVDGLLKPCNIGYPPSRCFEVVSEYVYTNEAEKLPIIK